MRLDQLPPGQDAEVLEVAEPLALHGQAIVDPISRRLRELGFVAGEAVRILARGPFGADPLLVQIGYTRFALRRSEAARVRIHCQPV
jgi:ferrous iron transport protein A